jgi:CheY-like chemotaxis protein
LADDSMTIQKVVELTFSDSDFELMTVGSGDKAVQALTTFKPDVVLADAVMPGLTGYEVCEAVKRMPGGATIPVIILTGTFEPFDRPRADHAGCDAVVTKPFDSHALAAQVKDLVQRAQAAREAAPTAAAQPFTPEPTPSFEDVDLDRPDALYATTALRIPSPEELEQIARDEAHIRSMAADADPTPLFEVASTPAEAAPAIESPDALTYETTAPLPYEPSHAAAEPVLPEALEEAVPVSEVLELDEPMELAQPVEPASEPVAADDAFDATIPMGGRMEGPAAGDWPAEEIHIEPASEVPVVSPQTEDLTAQDTEHIAVYTPEPEPLAAPQEQAEAIVVEPLVEEALVEEPAPEPFAEEPAPIEAAPGSAAGDAFADTGEIVVEPIVEEDVFGAAPPPLEMPDVRLGTGAEPEQGDVMEAIAAYERRESSSSMPVADAQPQEQKDAEVSELEALAAHTQIDDLKHLIPAAAESTGRGALSPGEVDTIARRVMELLGEKVVREVAWEVVPELAERLVRARLQELEGA